MSRRGRKREHDPARHAREEAAAIGELDVVRSPLFAELREVARRPDYYKGREPHVCCTRQFNRMRISPLEANAIAAAFRRDPRLRRHLPRVLERLERELTGLVDGEERQAFDCPLLDGTRCLVHDVAKPIGCTAWHPPEPGEDFELTPAGWRAFAERDQLNDRVYGPRWKLRVIPLWLARVFRAELGRRSRRSSPDARAPSRGARGRRADGPPGGSRNVARRRGR